METVNDTRWVLLEEGYPHTVFLTKKEADEILERYTNKFPDLSYALFYDEYYEFTEIINEN
jgi:hypothetical protein